MHQSILLIILMSLFLSSPAQPPIELKIEPYTFENKKGKTVEAELGTFEVLENRQRPEGKKLNIRFVRFKSTNPNPGAPIVYLAGGPGGSGVRTAQGSRFDLFMSMRSIADVIAYDQRGTGLSDGMERYDGYWLAEPSEPLDAEKVAPQIKAAALQAAEFFQSKGHDLSGYNSNENADDLNDLRRALGVDKISLWSISYGSHLALTTLKRHEPHIDRIILAGVEGYDHTVKHPQDQQELMETIDQLLKQNPKTATVYPDLLGEVQQLLDRVEKQPAMVKARHPQTGEEIEVAIGKLDLQIHLAALLRGPSMFKSMPRLVREMNQGDFSGIRHYALMTKYGNYRGMSMAMDMASGISAERQHSLRQAATKTLLGDAINFPYLLEWEALQHLDLGPAFRASFSSAVPVLCISGTLDGRTPPNNAVETLRFLSNGHHLIIDGAGHSDPLFLSSPKIEEMMLAFMQGKPIEDQTITLPPVEFELPKS
ncbi:MAG: alpha/beta fold hydrolase [Bacteroidota bacterium]